MVYGFLDEITQKYGNQSPWKMFNDVFDYLPLGAIVDEKIFCIHGGLSPHIRTIDQIRTIQRNIEIPHEGPYCDLMWSDPDNVDTWVMSNRGAGWLFGQRVVQEFNKINGLDLVVRAHQLVQEGYQYWFEGNILVTVWSAPNYFYRCGNIASILQLDEYQDRQFKTFKEVPKSAQSVNPRFVLPYFL